jgi:hypothetical protein
VWQTPLEIYNNTIDMIQYPGGPPPSVESAIAIWAGSRKVKFYNNILSGIVSSKMLAINPNAASLWDYNLFPTTMQWRLFDDSTGAPAGDYTSLAALQSAIVSAGGIPSVDANGIATSSPGFVVVGSRAGRYQLTGGAAAQGAGRISGTTSDAVCDMGAFGGVIIPTHVGCDF